MANMHIRVAQVGALQKEVEMLRTTLAESEHATEEINELRAGEPVGYRLKQPFRSSLKYFRETRFVYVREETCRDSGR